MVTSQKCVVSCLLVLTGFWIAIKLDHTGFRLPKVDSTVHRLLPTSASSFKCKPLSQKERLDAFGDLQGYTHRIYTTSPEAQKAFDTGLML
eukprot:scaffold205055_cov18-Tisochrysis_lutea.AAC.1